MGSAACVGTMTTLPVVPGIAHLNIACTWSLWALVCADIQQDIIMDFPSPKLNTMLGLPFFHLHSPFCSYIWGLLTSMCLFSKHTCKQPCLCPIEWDLRTHSKPARIPWDFTTPPVWGQPSVPQQSWWAVWLLVLQHNAGYLHFTTWGWPKLFWLAHKVDRGQEHFVPCSLG